jgi:molybdenum-dependent DNA-binding transcriptional regulator ModE
MIIACPKCGEKVVVKGLGRKPLNMPLKNVYDAIQAHGSVAAAAGKLGCSPAYIFKVLKDNGVNLGEVFGEQKR